MDAPLRCLKCGALVVDRRSANCTTCAEPLPADWVLSPGQVEKLAAIDQAARAEHAAAMDDLAPETDPNTPLLTPDDDPTNDH
jgi:DNA-directed RNA polymerase subunit N (RpoN/RPB10)